MKIERLLGIVLLLLNRKKITAPELAERFEVSVRTIYRDIEAIDAAGIPIVSFQGTGGGFGILDSYRLERQLLTPDDTLTLLSVLQGVDDALSLESVHESSKKIQSLVPKEAMSRLTDEVKIELSPWGYRGEQDELLTLLSQSVSKRRIVSFSYSNTKGEHIRRQVEPMTLVFKGSSWYLFGYCLVKKDYRMFRLSRMNEMRFDNQSFERRAYTYDQFSEATLEQDGRPLVDFVLDFSSAVRFSVEDMFAKEQVERLKDGTMRVRVSMPEDTWILSFLLSFGEHLTVLEPKRIRKQLANTAHALITKYEDPH
jgi:predicted DNA-binding transcriptional regulator YafY